MFLSNRRKSFYNESIMTKKKLQNDTRPFMRIARFCLLLIATTVASARVVAEEVKDAADAKTTSRPF